MFNFANGWGIVWTVTVLSAYLICMVVLFVVIADLFDDHELIPSGKTVWIAFLIFVPFLTLLLYIVVRGRGMAGRRHRQDLHVSQANDTYLRNLRLQYSAADEILKARSLFDEGILTQEQYERIKAIALAA